MESCLGDLNLTWCIIYLDDITREHAAGSKRAHDEDIDKDDKGEDGDGSMFKDLDEPAPTPMKRSGIL